MNDYDLEEEVRLERLEISLYDKAWDEAGLSMKDFL